MLAVGFKFKQISTTIAPRATGKPAPPHQLRNSYLDALNNIQLITSAAILFVAYLVRGIAGFGSALVAVPLLSLLLPLSVTVPLIILLDYIASLGHGLHNRSAILWRDLFPLLPFTLLGVLSAIYVLKTVDLALLSTTLGWLILIYAIYSLINYTPHKGHSRGWAVPAGYFGGLIGTLFGTGGPFYVIYIKLRGHDKRSFRATFATIFLIDGSIRIISYLFSGLLTLQHLMMVAFALPLMIIAMYFGGHIHTSLSPANFQRAISLLLIGSGILLVLKQ